MSLSASPVVHVSAKGYSGLNLDRVQKEMRQFLDLDSERVQIQKGSGFQISADLNTMLQKVENIWDLLSVPPFPEEEEIDDFASSPRAGLVFTHIKDLVSFFGASHGALADAADDMYPNSDYIWTGAERLLEQSELASTFAVSLFALRTVEFDRQQAYSDGMDQIVALAEKIPRTIEDLGRILCTDSFLKKPSAMDRVFSHIVDLRYQMRDYHALLVNTFLQMYGYSTEMRGLASDIIQQCQFYKSEHQRLNMSLSPPPLVRS